MKLRALKLGNYIVSVGCVEYGTMSGLNLVILIHAHPMKFQNQT